MAPINKLFAYGRNSNDDRDEIEYKSVDSLQTDDESQPTPDNSSMIELAKTKKKLRFYRTGFYLKVASSALFFAWFWFFRDGDAPHATYQDLEWSGLLGEDWNGIIPNGMLSRNEDAKCGWPSTLTIVTKIHRGIRSRVPIKDDLLRSRPPLLYARGHIRRL